MNILTRALHAAVIEPNVLQVSGLTYHWDGNRPVGSRVVAAQHEGLPIDPMQVYSVVVNSFIAGGGDGFAVFTQGVDRSVGPVDLDALVHYVEQLGAPVNATIEGRILTP